MTVSDGVSPSPKSSTVLQYSSITEYLNKPQYVCDVYSSHTGERNATTLASVQQKRFGVG